LVSLLVFCIIKKNLIILYKQFNFRLAPQTFGLVTSSNRFPKCNLIFSFLSHLANNALGSFKCIVTEYCWKAILNLIILCSHDLHYFAWWLPTLWPVNNNGWRRRTLQKYLAFFAWSEKISLLLCHGKPCKQLVDEWRFNASLNTVA